MADPAGAERAVAEAEALAERGDLVGAAARYRDAFREHPRPDLMCNVGVAYYKAKDLPRAHRYLDQCLAIGTSLDASFIATVKTVLAAVEQKLASDSYKPLSFLVHPASATTAFDRLHDEPLVGSNRIWVPLGTYTATVRADGYVARVLEIQATDASPAEYNVRLDRAPAPQEPPSATSVDLSATAPRPPERSLVAPIVVSAGTGVLGGIALGLYFSALSSAEQAGDRDNSAMEYESHADDARARQRLSWSLGAAAGIAGVIGGVLWYRALKTPARVDVHASGSAASVALTHRW